MTSLATMTLDQIKQTGAPPIGVLEARLADTRELHQRAVGSANAREAAMPLSAAWLSGATFAYRFCIELLSAGAQITAGADAGHKARREAGCG